MTKIVSSGQLFDLVNTLKRYGATKIYFGDSSTIQNMFKNIDTIGFQRQIFNPKFYIAGVEIIQDEEYQKKMAQ